MELLTIDEAAKNLRVSRWTVQRLIDEQKLAAILVGAGARKRVQRISAADLELFISERRTIEKKRGGKRC